MRSNTSLNSAPETGWRGFFPGLARICRINRTS
jgi:hypothetical protein